MKLMKLSNRLRNFINQHSLLVQLVAKFIIAIMALASFAGGCSWVNRQLGIADDGFVEEYIEIEIFKNTGVDVDLTPETKEN